MTSASTDVKTPVHEEEEVSFPSLPYSALDTWKNRIIIPTVLAGIAGGGFGLVSRQRAIHGVSAVASAYAANFAIVTGCYCGAREFVKASRTGKPDDLLNSVVGGFGSGAILGRIHGGPTAAARYSVVFAAVGTSVDYAIVKARPPLRSWYDSVISSKDNEDSWLRLPEWSPIKVLDEEALAAKRAREDKMYRNVHDLPGDKS